MAVNVVWDELIYNGEGIPIQIHYERRNSIRTAFGKNCLIIRIPAQQKQSIQHENLAKAKTWALRTLNRNPELLKRYASHNYTNGDTIRVLEQDFYIHITEADRKTGKGTLVHETIHLTVPTGLDASDRAKLTSTLLSRVIAKNFLYYIENRVNFYNERFFKEHINKISLKYNFSNWGSCSSKRNLNFSTRLLLTPKHIIDYIIVHEMAHLKEMNHSKKFWSIVASVYPAYKEAEKWLNKYGHKCYF